MMHHTAIELLRAELKIAEATAAEVKADTKDEIDAGIRAQRKLSNANDRVSDLKASIVALDTAKNEGRVEG